ncbi:hypothetical protein [Ruminococcus sp.]|uniref:hypothetical protein n=1 Tax=Ruminococcus sp. TaxID=41978 RepID=UPI0025896BC2|nr:hypothetical protein [Ruminococcus sp.]MCR5020737.1 hypothetical protein [Ruminococcus sp.]
MKIAALSAAVIMAFSLTGCGEKTSVDMDVSSEKYVGNELPHTVHSLEVTLESQGKIPDKIRYFGDEYCGDETLKKLKEECAFEEDSKVVECIGYEVDYHYSKNPFVVLRSIFGGKYTEKREDVQYWFVREDGGEWVCVNDEKAVL